MQKINNNSIEKIKANFNCTWVYYYNHKQASRLYLYAKTKRSSHTNTHTEFTTQFTALVIFIIPYNSLSLEKNVTNIYQTQHPTQHHRNVFKWIPFKITINYVAVFVAIYQVGTQGERENEKERTGYLHIVGGFLQNILTKSMQIIIYYYYYLYNITQAFVSLKKRQPETMRTRTCTSCVIKLVLKWVFSYTE